MIALAVSTTDPSDLLVIPAKQLRAYGASFFVISINQCCDHFVGVIRVRALTSSSIFQVILVIFMLSLVSDMLSLMLSIINCGGFVMNG